jgi:uncharacterized Tic20 family protein
MNDDNDGFAFAPANGITADARQWAMFAHLSALLGGIVTAQWGGSVGCFVGPLVIWLAKRDTMPFVADQAKEALNFNITVATVFFVLLMLTRGFGALLSVPLFIVFGIAWLVLTILASIKANEGVAYRYPFALRLIR